MEFHWPGYQYLGPGTYLEKRLARGDPGINRLDRIAKAHDIDYGKAKDLKDKWAADRPTERIVKNSQQARAPILVRAEGGLISTATTADQFPITDKRYFRN